MLLIIEIFFVDNKICLELEKKIFIKFQKLKFDLPSFIVLSKYHPLSNVLSQICKHLSNTK